tara:strand:- start:242 stop:475 length:234 start_codon:yes stop_codon:yes gene_type:complete
MEKEEENKEKEILESEKKENEESLDVVIGSEEDVLWNRVKEEVAEILKKLKNDILINEELLKIANQKLEHLDLTTGN